MITHQPYPGDVLDAEWQFVVPYLCLLPEETGQRVHGLSDIFDSANWLVRSGSVRKPPILSLYRGRHSVATLGLKMPVAVANLRPVDAVPLGGHFPGLGRNFHSHRQTGSNNVHKLGSWMFLISPPTHGLPVNGDKPGGGKIRARGR